MNGTSQTSWQCFRCGSTQFTGTKCADGFDDRSECATSPWCTAMHPLTATVLCSMPRHGSDSPHGCGDMPGCATWNDGDIEWRYLPYANEEQWRRLHGLEEERPN